MAPGQTNIKRAITKETKISCSIKIKKKILRKRDSQRKSKYLQIKRDTIRNICSKQSFKNKTKFKLSSRNKNYKYQQNEEYNEKCNKFQNLLIIKFVCMRSIIQGFFSIFGGGRYLDFYYCFQAMIFSLKFSFFVCGQYRLSYCENLPIDPPLICSVC